MPCVPAFEEQVKVATIATAAGFETIVYNSDGQPNALGTNQSIANGQTKNINFEFNGENDLDYGNNFAGGCPNVLVMKINDTVDKITVASGPCAATETPKQHGLTTDYELYSFTVPVVADTEQVSCIFNIDNINGQDIVAGDDMTWILYDSFGFFNSRSGNDYTCGVEDEDYTDYGIATEETGTFYFQ
jgi:hypothetical protein